LKKKIEDFAPHRLIAKVRPPELIARSTPGRDSGTPWEKQTSAIRALVDRVELKSDGMRVSIKLPTAGAEKSRAQPPDQVAIARSFPMQLKRRGVELRLIVGDHNRSAAIVDLSLLRPLLGHIAGSTRSAPERQDLLLPSLRAKD
jgi:hypothetical protein